MIFPILCILLILITIYGYFYRLGSKDRKYFTDRGILYLGNVNYRLLLCNFRGISFSENALQMYKEATQENSKIAGLKEFGQSGLMITDLDLIKQVMVRDFDHFVDRRQFKLPKNDYLMNRMLIMLSGDKWKALRSKMSPTFTTGKIRNMFPIFDKSSKKLVKYVETEMEKSGQIDLQEGYSKYTIDVIASAAFGLESQAFEQEGPSIFEKMGLELQFKMSGMAFIKLLCITIFPRFTNFIGLSFFSTAVQDFFFKVIKSTLKHRKESGEKRDDFIQLMMEAQEDRVKVEEEELNDFEKEAIIKTVKTEVSKKSIRLQEEDIAAQSVLFILGGFDTTQSLLIYIAYALALHQDVQERLYREIVDSVAENREDFTYDSVNRMEYLEMVVNETLRYYTPTAITDRSCTKEYKLPDSDFVLRKGNGIVIPVLGIHRDGRYHPEPDRFNPDRFSSQNRPKMNPYAFLPFGLGPRNCIGMRFAITEVKLAIARLVQNFCIEPSEKTLIPMKFTNTNTLKPVGGMWLKLSKRK